MNDAATATQVAMIRGLTPAERFVRALALTAYVRRLAWQGAYRRAGALGPEAIIDRFITQLHGVTIAHAFREARDAQHE
jgi:hypothetical protein